MPNPDPGPYTAEFLDADGKQLSSVEFDVSVPVGDSPAGDGPAVDSPTDGDSPSEQSADGLFVVPVAEPGPEAVTLRILRDGEELAVSKASEHPPTVEIESPSKGEILKGDEATIRWTGSDPDGDEVTYTLRHGIPGGMQTAGVDLTTTETSLFLDELGRGSTIRVQVIASDGFHSSQDEVSGVIVANP
jgi:hypothetical protein